MSTQQPTDRPTGADLRNGSAPVGPLPMAKRMAAAPVAKRLPVRSNGSGTNGSGTNGSGTNGSGTNGSATNGSGGSHAVAKSSTGTASTANGSSTAQGANGVKKIATGPKAEQPVQQQPMADTASDETAAVIELDEPPAWQEWVRQSPSWLCSMVVHMVLLLSMALVTLEEVERPFVRELLVDQAELEEPFEEFKEETIDQVIEAELQVENPLTNVTPLTVSPEDTIDTEEMVIEADADQQELAQQIQVDIDTSLLVDTSLFDASEAVGGTSLSGLGGRSGHGRPALVRKAGGNADSERAVERALTWLAAQQLRDGSWSFAHIGASTNPGKYKTRMGATGLALLPFLGAGYTHESGKYEENVRAGLAFLVGNMAVSNGRGRLYENGAESHAHMYSHGIAAIALCEAYGMTGDTKLMAPAQLSLNYIVDAQNPKTGSWLYTPRSPGGDTSVLGWQVMALKSGHMAYLNVPANVTRGASHWLDTVQFNSGAAYGYRKKNDRPAAGCMTAVGLLMRMYLGWEHDNPALQIGVEALGKAGPSNNDMYYNYYATQVMRHYEGEIWETWNTEMRDYLVRTQAREGANTGSWHFGGAHGADQAGRLYNTALSTMILEVYYRHLPIYQKQVTENKFIVD